MSVTPYGWMCGRYAVTTDPAKLAAEIEAVNEVPDLPSDGSNRLRRPRPRRVSTTTSPPFTMVMTGGQTARPRESR